MYKVIDKHTGDIEFSGGDFSLVDYVNDKLLEFRGPKNFSVIGVADAIEYINEVWNDRFEIVEKSRVDNYYYLRVEAEFDDINGYMMDFVVSEKEGKDALLDYIFNDMEIPVEDVSQSWLNAVNNGDIYGGDDFYHFRTPGGKHAEISAFKQITEDEYHKLADFIFG